MTRSDPTGRAYKDALVNVRAAVPDAADAIKAHVAHLERRVAYLTEQHTALQARVGELVSIKTNPAEHETEFMVVTGGDEPASMTSAPMIAAAAMQLLTQLHEPDLDPAEVLETAAVTHGQLALPIFLVALQATVAFGRPDWQPGNTP